MAQKNSKRRSKKGGRPGRKSIQSGEDPLIEARLKIVADLWAGRRGRSQIVAHFAEENEKEIKKVDGDAKKASQLYAVGARAIEAYLREVRRRWKEDDATETILEKKRHLIRGYERAIRIAEGKVKFIKELYDCNKDGSGFVPAPETFAIIQALDAIARIEGFVTNTEPEDNDLDDILDALEQKRSKQRAKKGS